MIEFTLGENYDISWFDRGWNDLPRTTFGRPGPESRMEYDTIRFTPDRPFAGFHATWSDYTKFSINQLGAITYERDCFQEPV